MRQTVFDYMQKKYQVSPEYPWKKSDKNAVFRHSDNNKWFALVINVRRDKLGLSGIEHIDVINLKINDMFYRDMILQKMGIIPAYHMNKQYWITVLLDGTVETEMLFELIDMSFMATASTKKKEQVRPPKEWIIPANPKYYPIEQAFDTQDTIDWKQGRGIRTGDTVFMYVAAPVSAILFQCKVIETNIPYDHKNKNLVITSLMKIKLVKKYSPHQFTFDVLKEEYGIYAVRGPRGIPNSLHMALQE